ncbi:MAG: acetoacetate decarboxylase family protein [Acidimicrobiales bacterium]
MPFFGTLDLAVGLAGAPVMTNLSPDTWKLPGADVLQVSYEVDEAASLAITPSSLHPSIPPYATFSVARFPESPHGPFHLAFVRLIVRAGIRPRGLLIGAWCDNEAASAALAAGWGYKVGPAEVSFVRNYQAIRGTVTIGGRTALDVGLVDPEPIVGADLELFDNLHLTNVEGKDPVIVQVDPTYVYRSADRGRADLATYDPEALGTEGIEPVYRVIAVSCSADMELAAPRFVIDPTKPAISGTRRL